VYCLAIALVEHLGSRATRVPIQVFGTDVDAEAIRLARRARYPSAAVDVVGRTRRERFFRRTGEAYEVSRELRDRCVFGRHDLSLDPPFSNLDMVSCRGLLDRIAHSSRERLVPLLHHALKPSGVLLTDSRPVIAGLEGSFTRLDSEGRMRVWKPSVSGSAPVFTSLPPRPRRPSRVAPPSAPISSPRAPRGERRDLDRTLLAANEDLETANEELQSANEELDTVNEELQKRNAELAETRSDLVHLLGSMDLGVVLVDRNLRIRRFTSIAQREWRLEPSDVGRSLDDTRLGVQVPALQEMATTVLSDGTPLAREVRDPRGRWQSVRVRPYRSSEGSIEGAVVTLTDVHVLRRARDRFRALIESAPDAMVLFDSAGRIELVNAQVERLFGYRRDELVGQPLETLVPSTSVESRWLARYLKNLRLPFRGTRLELVTRRKDGDELPVEVSLSRIVMEEGALVSSTIRDTTEARRLAESARRAAVLDERNRLAREVHDNLAQGLTAIVVQLEVAEEALASDTEEARRRIVLARDLARRGLEEARRALLALRPGPLDVGDLPEAIRRMAVTLSRGVEVQVSVRGSRGRLVPLLEDNLLRIAQEAVGNALKHAGASRVRADLTYSPHVFRMRIEDDGSGFEQRRVAPGVGLGLSIMRERAERMGAALRIRSGRTKGTRVEVRVPLAAPAEG